MLKRVEWSLFLDQDDNIKASAVISALKSFIGFNEETGCFSLEFSPELKIQIENARFGSRQTSLYNRIFFAGDFPSDLLDSSLLFSKMKEVLKNLENEIHGLLEIERSIKLTVDNEMTAREEISKPVQNTEPEKKILDLSNFSIIDKLGISIIILSLIATIIGVFAAPMRFLVIPCASCVLGFFIVLTGTVLGLKKK